MAQNFQKDMRFGLKAELIFKKHLEETQEDMVVHMTGHFKWFDMVTLGKEIVTYEVKNDTRIKETKNLCLELWSHKVLGHPGWVKYSRANYIVYFMSEREYLIIPMEEIRDYLSNTENLKDKRIVSGWSGGNFHVENILIPYTEFTKTIHKIRDD